MSYSPDQDVAARHIPGKPDPFASLAVEPSRRRFSLFELLMAPFRDHDERAAYRTHKLNGHKASRKAAKANGFAAAAPAYKMVEPVPDGRAPVNGRPAPQFSPAGRQPYGQ